MDTLVITTQETYYSFHMCPSVSKRQSTIRSAAHMPKALCENLKEKRRKRLQTRRHARKRAMQPELMLNSLRHSRVKMQGTREKVQISSRQERHL